MAAIPLDPRTPVVHLLDRFGPDAARGEPTSPAASKAYVEGLATSHYENFSVLSKLVPERLRSPFAAVYAFCRWADDLGDETGAGDDARARSTRLLNWWREELDRAYDGDASHPVYVALLPVIRQFDLPKQPFADLIDAFSQDQRVTRYQTWDQVCDYCTRSANPVGRLVLMLAGYRPERPSDAQRFTQSDAICTALQLTNFWQDVRRDLVDRDRVYVPEQETGISAAQLRDWMNRGDEPEIRIAYIHAIRPLVEKTWALFQQGQGLPATLEPGIRPVVWLFQRGGESVLTAVERTGCTTLWQRPKLSKIKKGSLVMGAMARRVLGGFGAANASASGSPAPVQEARA